VNSESESEIGAHMREDGDPYELQRFIDAQDRVYNSVLCELQGGHKKGHWMWFIFPQIEGLGKSHTARRFAISCREEAEAYLRHPTLAARLRECTQLVIAAEGQSPEEIFGVLDSLKFRSSMTLFSHATSDNAVFTEALHKYFRGDMDRLTLNRL
jgi:uncharacterized protein (DUF1810 family)